MSALQLPFPSFHFATELQNVFCNFAAEILKYKCYMDYLMNILQAVVDLVNEMSPYLLLGFLLAGVMHAFIPNGWYAKYLSGRSFRSVFNAAVFGVPLPLCSCGVIPTAMSLKKEGASNGAVTSFLVATPQTGVDSIFATYSLMGLPFAIVRPIAALVTAMMGGALVNGFDNSQEETTESNRRARNVSEEHLSFCQRCVKALRFGFVEMMEDIGKWLVVGLVVAGLITVLVPDSFFAAFKDNTLMSMLLVLCISIPMYLCATGSIPIAVALMMKGLTPGAALVLLMAGPASNAASILVINKVLGRRPMLLYLFSIVFGAIAFGFGIDYLLPREWFTASLIGSDACCHEEAGWFAWTCTGLMLLLLLNVLRMRLMHKETCSCGSAHDHCGCGHDHCGCDDAHCGCDDDCETLLFDVKGMNCNHCKASVEKAIMSVDGVETVEVDLHSGSAVVVGDDLSPDDIIHAVESIGFSATAKA